MSIRNFSVEAPAGRLDVFLRDAMSNLSRSEIEKCIAGGRVTLNGSVCRKKNRSLIPGDKIEFNLPESVPVSLSGEFHFNRLYEDSDILIINKPSGIAVHQGSGIREATIADYFEHLYPELQLPGESGRKGIVHRLDKGTSGVMILAKNERAYHSLQKNFKNRKLEKTYVALLSGRLKSRYGEIELPLKRSTRDRRKYRVQTGRDTADSRTAHTGYRLLLQFPDSAYVRIRLHTGRTHQIRVHMAHMGNAVLGDELYGKKSNFPRLALHAYSIAFFHPVQKNLHLTSYAEIPEEFIRHFSGPFPLPFPSF